MRPKTPSAVSSYLLELVSSSAGERTFYNAKERSVVLSDLEIRKSVDDGHVVIHPLIPENIRGSSVDVTLGEWFYVCEQLGNRTRYNPFSQGDVERYFRLERAIPNGEWAERNGARPWEGIPLDHPVIVLNPGERILAHTHEFIGIHPPGTTEMRARSSWGRNGVAACFDAGWGDPGYINRWTMEVFNLNSHMQVPLPVGERIAQIIFHQTGEVERHYGAAGKYQGGTDLTAIVRGWSPEQMLPRAYRDSRREPLPL